MFTSKVLGKYDVNYYKCAETGFIQTEEAYWLDEAYSSAITKLDVGLVIRNQNMVNVTAKLLYNHFDHDKKFLDYAGGYGLFTRLMRDKGYDFYSTDIYCQNIFAEYQDLLHLPPATPFELTTAFEVLEHLPDPMTGIAELFKYSSNVFFSTEIVPTDLPDLKDWWYFSFETGQHIAFYSTDALKYIAKKFNRHFYTDNKSLHLFTDKKLSSDPFIAEVPHEDTYLIKKIRAKLKRYDRRNNVNKAVPEKPSLMGTDLAEAKKRIS